MRKGGELAVQQGQYTLGIHGPRGQPSKEGSAGSGAETGRGRREVNKGGGTQPPPSCHWPCSKGTKYTNAGAISLGEYSTYLLINQLNVF